MTLAAAKARSAAERELAHLQRNYPRPEALDLAQVVFAMNPGKTQLQLAVQLHGAILMCAEVGSTAPNAYTRCFYDESRLVMLNTGLIDFVRAVNQTLFGNTQFYFGKAPAVAPALSPKESADRLAALYEAWHSGGLWQEERLHADPVGLDPQAAEDAELFTRAALLFILSHELGHAVMHADKLSADGAPGELSQSDELDADAFGIRLVMTGWGDGRGKPWRVAAAGAMIALRTLSGLARLGHVFPGNHPSPDLRLAKLRDILRELCVTEEAYYHVTSIAIAREEEMEGAELILGGGDVKTTSTCERIVSSFCAILEEGQKGVLSREAVAAALAERVENTADGVLTEAGTVAGRILSPHSPWFAESEGRRTMVGLLQSSMPSLPVLLSDAYASAQAT